MAAPRKPVQPASPAPAPPAAEPVSKPDLKPAEPVSVAAPPTGEPVNRPDLTPADPVNDAAPPSAEPVNRPDLTPAEPVSVAAPPTAEPVNVSAPPQAEPPSAEPPSDEPVGATAQPISAESAGGTEAHAGGPGGLRAEVGARGHAAGDLDVDTSGVAGGYSVGADVGGVEVGQSGSAHVGLDGAGFETSTMTEIGDDKVSAGTSQSSGADIDLKPGTGSAHADTRAEGHLDVFDTHVGAEGEAYGDARVDIASGTGSVEVGGSVDVAGVSEGGSTELHFGDDGFGTSTTIWGQVGDDDLGAGGSSSGTTTVDIDGDGGSFEDSSRQEAHADAFGAHAQGGIRSEHTGYLEGEGAGVDGGFSSELDIMGLEHDSSTDAHVGLDGASLTSTERGEIGDENLNVDAEATGTAGVDLTHGLEADAGFGVAGGADIRGFDLGIGSEVGGEVEIGGDGVSVGTDMSTTVEVGGTDVEVSTGTRASVGLDGASIEQRGEISGLGGVSAEADLGPGGAKIGGSADLGDMHAEGSFGTSDLENAWDSAGDTAEDAGNAAEDAWDSASDTADDAEEDAEGFVEDTGESLSDGNPFN